MAFIFVFFLILYLYHLDYKFYNYDEGTNLYASWELSQGKLPYRDFFFVYLPSIHIIMGYIFNRFGVSIFLARLLSVLFVFFTGFWVFYFGFKIYNKFSLAVLALSIFLLNPYTIVLGRIFLPIFFWLSLAFASLYFVYKFLTKERKINMFVAGVLMGISMYIKLVAIGFFISTILVLVLRRKFSAIRYYFLGFFLTFALPVVYLIYKFYPQIWAMAFRFHFVQKQHYLSYTLKSFIKKNFCLLVLGVPFIFKYRWQKHVLDDLLIISAGVVFFLPLISKKFIWIQYFYPLIPIFSIYCAYSLTKVKKFNVYSIVILIFTFLLCNDYLKKDFKYYKHQKKYDMGIVHLANSIRRYTRQGEYILSEIPHINILAGRENPPELADVSHTRIISQNITPQDVIDICEKYQVRVIVYPLRTVPFRLDLITTCPAFQKYLHHKFIFWKDIRNNYYILRVFVRRKQS